MPFSNILPHGGTPILSINPGCVVCDSCPRGSPDAFTLTTDMGFYSPGGGVPAFFCGDDDRAALCALLNSSFTLKRTGDETGCSYYCKITYTCDEGEDPGAVFTIEFFLNIGASGIGLSFGSYYTLTDGTQSASQEIAAFSYAADPYPYDCSSPVTVDYYYYFGGLCSVTGTSATITPIS
jgi:hypothetical protein